jgi:hypothetical protein
MSNELQAQWSHRLDHLHTLRDCFVLAHRSDRAYKVYPVIQHVYDRWADEVFSGQR